MSQDDTLGEFFNRVNQKNLQNTIRKLLLLRKKQLEDSLPRMVIPFISLLLFAQKTE
jgi:hypothetical protein